MSLDKRCPWCGEIIKGRFFQRGHYHCPNCGNYSKIYKYGWIYGLGAIVGLAFIIFLKYVFAIYSIFIFWIIYSIICIALPLEMETKHFIPKKKGTANFTLIKGAVKKVPKKKGCDLAKKQDSSLFCGIIKVS